MLKTLILTAVMAVFSASSFAVHAQSTTRVDGYTKRDGTYVAPHTRTSPNSTKSDNYSTQGNTNPWTGKQGTKSGD